MDPTDLLELAPTSSQCAAPSALILAMMSMAS